MKLRQKKGGEKVNLSTKMYMLDISYDASMINWVFKDFYEVIFMD